MSEVPPQRQWPRRLVQLGLVLSVALVVPRFWCGMGADALFEGRADAQLPLATHAAFVATHKLDALDFHTSDARFDGEWAYVTCQMSVLGLGQTILAHPNQKSALLPAMEACLDWMLRPEAAGFGVAPWPETQWEARTGRGHAWAGYLNMALGMHRLIEPDSRFAPHHDALTATLAARLKSEPLWALETYPGETYPADLSTVVGSVGLYDRATGSDHSAILAAWVESFRARAIDPRSGLVYQSLSPRTGDPTDKPRASGTAFSVYFLSFASPELSRTLFESLKAASWGTFAGFGGIDEYPPGVEGGIGDIDSGPVVFGVGPSATAFALAGARIHGDAEMFEGIWRTAVLFGAPFDRGDVGRAFVLGGPMGNALLLTMATARPVKGAP